MERTTVQDVQIIDIPIAHDVRGNLAVVEKETIPFELQRVYYLFDVPSNSHRGGHAHRALRQCIIALSGSFDVVLDDGRNKERITLNSPTQGLILPTGIWRELEHFSEGAVCLVLASDTFDEGDYIRDYKTFLKEKLV